PVNFEFATDKHSQCKWDYERGDFEILSNYFNELNFYVNNHTGTINLPSVEGLAAELGVNPSGDVVKRFLDLSMYVRCQDPHGNTNARDYEINFCLESGIDQTPPMIVQSVPENNAILEYGTTETLAILYLNEPAECKYSLEDKSYELMENKLICDTRVS